MSCFDLMADLPIGAACFAGMEHEGSGGSSLFLRIKHFEGMYNDKNRAYLLLVIFLLISSSLFECSPKSQTNAMDSKEMLKLLKVQNLIIENPDGVFRFEAPDYGDFPFDTSLIETVMPVSGVSFFRISTPSDYRTKLIIYTSRTHEVSWMLVHDVSDTFQVSMVCDTLGQRLYQYDYCSRKDLNFGSIWVMENNTFQKVSKVEIPTLNKSLSNELIDRIELTKMNVSRSGLFAIFNYQNYLDEPPIEIKNVHMKLQQNRKGISTNFSVNHDFGINVLD
ncbi:MAG TPA: hypothetical protein PLZ12_08930 [Saprospiraceae bacterium]|nr:hypothetical protein [Saprospiraceae bacterium]